MDNTYILKGTFEKEEGVPVQFSVQVNSTTPVNSMNEARAYFHDELQGNKILFTEVWLDGKLIPMMEALGLE